MSPIGDFFARILSAGGSRGLSGDSELVLPPDPALTYFNERLRRHTTSDDLVAEPERLWDSSGFLSRRGGLRGHLLSERGSGVIGISDVVVIVNQDDWRRSFREVRRPWVDRARSLLAERFAAFCRQEDFHTLFPQRPVSFTIVEDGSEAMRGHSLGLERGQFVTGLLPNHYTGPVETSRAVVAVHLLLPGVWDNYQVVGRLWSDQVLFTLGSHWLDNCQHERLQAPALYRLHRYGDGSFVHVVNPELRDAYQLSSQETPGGASVLTLETTEGEPVAYIVLAVLGPEESLPAPERPPESALGLVPTEEPAPPTLSIGSRTVVPLELDERILTLREQGALLQKVHFARFMEGYDVFIGRGGEVATAMAGPAATLHVRGRQVSIEAHIKGVRVGGRELHADQPIFLEGDTRISVGGTELQFRDLSGVQEDGWPYLAELRRSGSTSHMVFGSRYQIGRDPRCKVRLPDEPHNENIVWRPELRQGGSIRSRNGEIPKSRFYIDSIMVASEHAEIDLIDKPRVLSRARHCYTYVRRGGAVLPLFPARDGGGPMELGLEAGDELLIGNCVFEVQFVDPERHSPRSRAPEPLSAEMMASEVDRSEAIEPAPRIPALSPAPPDPASVPGLDAPPVVPGAAADFDPFDVPAAAGLGERGRMPKAIEPVLGSADSFRVDDAPEAPRIAPPMLAGAVDEFEPESAGLQPVEPGPTPDDPAMPPPTSPSMLHSIAPELRQGLDDDIADSFLPGPAAAGAPAASAAPERSDPPPPAPVVPPASRAEEVPAPAHLAPAVPDPAADPLDDPTGIPLRPPPPVQIDASGDSLLGDSLLGDAPLGGAPLGGRPLGQAAHGSGQASVSPASSSAAGASSAPSPKRARQAAAPSGFTPPVAPNPDGATVAVVDEAEWQVELTRPGRLVLVGFMVSGKRLVGNHLGADIVLPENRAEPGQPFAAMDYLEVFARGRRAKVTALAPTEVRLFESDVEVNAITQPDAARVEVIRRDPDGEEDFAISLALVQDDQLPDPRARLLQIDTRDRMVLALFTLGLPLRQTRTLDLAGLTCRVRFDGSGVELAGYLPDYRREDGSYRPVFVSNPGGGYRTLPEDGAPVLLQPGDRVISGCAVYAVEG